MRPEILFPYFAPTESLKGVGPKLAPFLIKHAGPHVRDLVFCLPQSLIYRPMVRLGEAESGQVQTARVTIGDYRTSGGKGPQRITVHDPTGEAQLVYFHAIKGMAIKHPTGAARLISGRFELFGGTLQMTHPDFIVDEAHESEIPRFEAVYPASQAISSRQMRKFIQTALSGLPELPEWHDPAILTRHGWMGFKHALIAAHSPETSADLEPAAPARQRLAYDEALAHQLALKARKSVRLASPAMAIPHSSEAEKAVRNLPFSLTGAQQKALEDIGGDLASGSRMNRLLQGDVGSGKTLVALLALIDVAAAGHQGVIMAPTEILARQHYEKALPMLEAVGITALLMTGRDKGTPREDKRAQAVSGEAQIIFGTHAVFQDGVEFKSLQLAVIDEQHRFGVGQRQRLFSKGEAVHYLSMSATPIPRTLALTQYGEADLSLLNEKPAGRQPILTAVIPRARLNEVYARLKAAIAEGNQAYWICPLVEETALSDLIAVEARHKALQEALGFEIGLVHGRMAGPEKDEVVAHFAAGELKVLCATTVVEVGIDVPRASIIIIEQAERFGLAQLHQLRGRVGRGAAKSACILLYDAPLSKLAKARLELLRDTEDGFEIAEMDWRLRGEGDLLGAKQSGFPDYRFVDPVAHADLIAMAAREAMYILGQGDHLPEARQKALNILRELFDWRHDASDKQD